MTVLRVRGIALPGAEAVDLYADGDRWTTDPVTGAELAGEGWLLPGLVDAHTHRRADHAELPDVAAAQAARTGWAKVIADWQPGDAPLPAGVLRQVVTAVHAAGGRVAVHSQHAAGGRAAVEAGVNSVEHGMCLDPGLLPQMAAQGTALTPTLSVITAEIPVLRQRPDGPRGDWYLAGGDSACRARRCGRRSRRHHPGRHRFPALRPGHR